MMNETRVFKISEIERCKDGSAYLTLGNGQVGAAEAHWMTTHMPEVGDLLNPDTMLLFRASVVPAKEPAPGLTEAQLKEASLKLEAYRAATAALASSRPVSSMVSGYSDGPGIGAVKTEAERLWSWMSNTKE